MLVQPKRKIKTIGLHPETYSLLARKRAELEIELGKRISFDECIKILCER